VIKIENIIIRHLLHDDSYLRKVVPFLKDEYFVDRCERKIVSAIRDFSEQYKAAPTIEALDIIFQNDVTLAGEDYTTLTELLETLREKTDSSSEWLLNTTEEFCKNKAVRNAIIQSIHILDGEDKTHIETAIPGILQEALGVCFDSSIGHDYLEDADERFKYYNTKEEKFEFDIELLNKITDGGIERKTLNVLMAGVGVGKSLGLCHFAASYLAKGLNVLYITLEMAEKKLAKRIDANLMNVSMRDLKDLPKQMFDDRIVKIRNRTEGTLIFKEYPTSTAHAGHFRALLNDLALKKEFVPDIIFIDYIGICASSRFKMSGGGSSVNSYTYFKGVSEELRGLAMEFNVPIWTAAQVNRSGYGSSDAEMTDIAESFGLAATADLLIALINTEELEKMGQFLVKQLKNRYDEKSLHRKFVVGVDLQKQRLFDAETNAQNDITEEDPPVVYRSRFSDKSFDNINL